MLQVTTRHWAMSFGSIVYSVELAALNPAGRREMASSRCNVRRESGKKTGDGETDETLLADDAARLKAVLESAATECADHFIQSIFPNHAKRVKPE